MPLENTLKKESVTVNIKSYRKPTSIDGMLPPEVGTLAPTAQ